jgi:ubiquinone/menaquinone biosynthesis C-methylase UbiE
MPYLLEDQIEKRGMKVIKVIHEEYPFILPSVFEAPNDAFAFTTLYAKEELGKLVRSGTNPYAFEDAQKTFDDIVAQGVMAHYEDGKVVMEGNRYKMVVARRAFEDGDTLKQLRKEGSIPNALDTKGMDKVKKFDDTLIDVYSRTNAVPWGHIVTSVKGVLQHHDMHQVNILDLATARGQLAIMMAQLFPDASVHAVDLSSDLIDQANKDIRSKGLLNIHTRVADVHDLGTFQDASFDVITCSFGLPFFARPEIVLHEVHRLLKPGGSFITTNWENLAIDHVSDMILEKLLGKAVTFDRDINPMSLSGPKTIESLIEASDLSMVHVDNEEFHLKLTGDEGPVDFSFQAVVGPIRSELNQLVSSGKNPNAMMDARVHFDKLIQDKKIFQTDSDGNVVTAANRYKLLIARRQYEDKLQ